MANHAGGAPVSARRWAARVFWGLLALGALAGFLALGQWQVERRAWKLDLIQRVEERVHADPLTAPRPMDWDGVNEDRDEYRPVRLHGTYLHDRDTLVQATTRLGGGYWVMTPLRRDDGTLVLINRGYVADRDADYARPQGPVTVTGLLRLDQPGGGFLRDNDPAADRWYSRDLAAIAEARDLAPVAPYFVDVTGDPDAAPEAGPVPGLTVIEFHNNHLVYAITWYILALMVAAGALYTARQEFRPGDQGDDDHDHSGSH